MIIIKMRILVREYQWIIMILPHLRNSDQFLTIVILVGYSKFIIADYF